MLECSDDAELALLKLKGTAVYDEKRLTAPEQRLVKKQMKCGTLRGRILASFITAVSGTATARRRAIEELRACCHIVREHTWAACYMSEAIMFLAGREVCDEVFLRFAIRGLGSRRREARVNAAGTLAEYARMGNLSVRNALLSATRDRDAAVRSNARRGLAK